MPLNSNDPRINFAPGDFNPEKDLPKGFFNFLAPFHRAFTSRQQKLIEQRARVLVDSHRGKLPDHLPPSEATTSDWRVEMPDWCQDQRNQMTGPADDPELTVKLLNSGSPAVMLDVEDSVANYWDNVTKGIENMHAALRGELAYFDRKRNRQVGIQNPKSKTVIWLRPRGLHLNQGGVFKDELCSAALFDVAAMAYTMAPQEMKHPLAIYIPKSESAEEALWWRDLFQAIEQAKGWERGYIKCMALVEAHPLAYQMEEFAYHLREHILGLNLGRWDYMASLAYFNLHDPNWVLPDRNTIPFDVLFFQRLRELMVELCHRRGLMAVGGMTALFPNREAPELNARALAVLERDKKNEANVGMDGAWTGHPDQNEIAVSQFPPPNQLHRRYPNAQRYPDLRPAPAGIGKRTLAGTRAAVRTVIRYRNGILNGSGANLIDGYMEDLATDRIYRVMIAQRLKHRDAVEVLDDGGKPVKHTPEFVSQIFDEELAHLLREPPAGVPDKYRAARRVSEEMIRHEQFDPV